MCCAQVRVAAAAPREPGLVVIGALCARIKDVPLLLDPHLDENGSMLCVRPKAPVVLIDPQGRFRSNNPGAAVVHLD